MAKKPMGGAAKGPSLTASTVTVKRNSVALPTKDPRLEGKYNPQVVNKTTRTETPAAPPKKGLTIRAEGGWSEERPVALGKKKA